MQRSPVNQVEIADALFISPHLDDAALSATHTIHSFVKKQMHAIVVTVFTQGSAHINSDIQTYLKNSGGYDYHSLFQKRRTEDIKALKILGASNIMHLSFVDGLFRSTNDDLIYPSFQKVFRGQISSQDTSTSVEILKQLHRLKIKHTNRKTHIYTCLGVGNHVDHILVHNAVTQVFGPQTTYWEDVPYRATPTKLFSRLARISMPLKHVPVDNLRASRIKQRALACYTSQFPGLLQGGLGDIDYLHEVLYEQ